jgi:hypothetical protein
VTESVEGQKHAGLLAKSLREWNGERSCEVVPRGRIPKLQVNTEGRVVTSEGRRVHLHQDPGIALQVNQAVRGFANAREAASVQVDVTCKDHGSFVGELHIAS